jgi:serine phosphatase RsbU (regulator of sigma subunit)
MVPASPFASAGRYAFDNSPILPRWMTRSKITGEHAAMAGNVAVQPSGRFRERPVTVTAASGEFRRLSALITRQRRELDVMKSQAAARAVVDLARGVLMGRLDCSPAQAQAQLARLSQESRTSVPELAAQIAGQPSPEAAPEPAAPSAAEPGTSGTSGNALVSAAVELADDGSRIAAAVLEEALAPAGAAAVALWLVEPDGGLELVGEAGFGPSETSRWRRIHPDMDTAAQRAANGGLESWWPAGNPGGETAPAIGHWPKGARAVIPLPGTGVALGAMEVCWPEPLAEFPDPMRRQLIALAEVCAQTLGVRLERGDPAADHRAAWAFGFLDSLPGSALFAQAVRDDGRQVTDFRICYLSDGFTDPAGRCPADLAGRPLLEIYPAAALPGGLFDRALQVLATGEPQNMSGEVISAAVGDAMVVPVMDVRITGLYGGVVVAWRRADEVERLTALLEQAQRLGRIGGWEENLLTGDVVWTEPTFALFGQRRGAPVPVAELHAHVPADDIPEVERFRHALLGEKRGTAAAFRIIRTDDQSVRQMRAFAEPVTDPAGTLVAVRGAYQDMSADYHTQVAFAATRDRLADTEERAEEDRRLALRLQQAITPRSAVPVETPGLDVAARYRPAGPGSLVSGDWYDTVLLPTQQVLLVVGDIAGHGIDAVTGMVALRNCLRGLAITGAGPAALLDWLNKVACYLTDGIIGTAVCGLYDPARRSLRWARAGHLPPILVRNGAARELPLPQGVLLGADPDASYEEATTSLRTGDVLALFTDGLIERRDGDIDDALESLMRIASTPVGEIGSFADHLLSQARSDTSDDACLVAVQVR